MPNVNLDVRNFPSNGSDGYTDTTASNNAIYSYCYTGGSDGHGTMNETADTGSASFTVTVGADPRYQISNVAFSGDIENQLSWAQGGSPTIAVITDSDTATGSGAYSITVSDTTAQCTLPCDPGINNQPKPPMMNAGRSAAATHAPSGARH